MKKNKISFGSFLLAFIRGMITLILALILVASVASNIIFYADNSAVDIDLFNMNYTFFVNNSANLENIPKDSLVIVNHKDAPQLNTYVLCTVGSGYKTVLCLSDVTQNENGTDSYEVKGDRTGSTINYKIPQSKIIGTVINKNDFAGKIIVFSRKISGIIALMAIPAFLLIVMSITGIKRNKTKYEDDLLESEILAEELRKLKKVGESTGAAASENVSGQENNYQDNYEDTRYYSDEKSPSDNISDDQYEYSKPETDIDRKAVQIKNAIHNQKLRESGIDTSDSIFNEKPLTANDIINQVSDEMKQNPYNTQKPVYQERPAYRETPVYQEKPRPAENPAYREAPVYQEKLRPGEKPIYREAPVYQEKPRYAEKPAYTETPAYQDKPRYAEKPVYPEQSIYTEKITEIPKPVYTEPAVKNNSTVQQPVKPMPAKKVSKNTLKADSIDDLIKILESEKKKLD